MRFTESTDPSKSAVPDHGANFSDDEREFQTMYSKIDKGRIKNLYRMSAWWHYAWLFSRHEAFVQDVVASHLRRLEDRGSCRVLDVGCGPRQIVRSTVEAVNAHYAGVDVYPSNEHLQFDGISLPFKAKSMDMVVSTEVLEHARDWEPLLAEMVRVLKDDGLLVLSIPFMFPVHGAPQDYRRLTTYGVRQAVEKAGALRVDVREFGGLGSILSFPVIRWRYHCVTVRAHPVTRLVSVIATPVILALVPLLNMLATALNRLDKSGLFYSQSVTVAKRTA